MRDREFELRYGLIIFCKFITCIHVSSSYLIKLLLFHVLIIFIFSVIFIVFPISYLFSDISITRKDMTHSVISIDSIIFNSMSTDSSAVKVLDS